MLDWNNMSSLLVALDTSLGKYQHIVATVEAFSTFLAVAVSLGISLASSRENRTHLSAVANIVLVFHGKMGRRSKPEYFTVSITNNGILPATIPVSFFSWRFLLERDGALINPMDFWENDDIPQKTYPVEIPPRRSETFYLCSLQDLRMTFREMRLHEDSLKRRLFFPFIRACIRSEDGVFFKVRLAKDIQHEIGVTGLKAPGKKSA